MTALPSPRLAALAGIALALALPAGAARADGQSVPVAGFEKLKVCACDCLYQYKVDVQADDGGRLSCKALDADGNWSEVRQKQYSPAPGLVLYTGEEYTDFACEVVRTASREAAASQR